MKDLVARLREGETVTLKLACDNVLTITPRGRFHRDGPRGFLVESTDEMKFAHTRLPEFEGDASLESKYLRFFVSMEALPQLAALVTALKRINVVPKVKPNKRKVYLRKMDNRYWVCSLKGMSNKAPEPREIYFRKGEKVLFNCSPSWFDTSSSAAYAVADSPFELDWNGL